MHDLDAMKIFIMIKKLNIDQNLQINSQIVNLDINIIRKDKNKIMFQLLNQISIL